MTKLPAVVSIRVRKTAGACAEWNKGNANKTASRNVIRSSVARRSCDSCASTQPTPFVSGEKSQFHSLPWVKKLSCGSLVKLPDDCKLHPSHSRMCND